MAYYLECVVCGEWVKRLEPGEHHCGRPMMAIQECEV